MFIIKVHSSYRTSLKFAKLYTFVFMCAQGMLINRCKLIKCIGRYSIGKNYVKVRYLNRACGHYESSK